MKDQDLSLEERALVRGFRASAGTGRDRLVLSLLSEVPTCITEEDVREIALFLGMNANSDPDWVIAAFRQNYYYNKQRGFPEGNPLDGIMTVSLPLLQQLVNDHDFPVCAG